MMPVSRDAQRPALSPPKPLRQQIAILAIQVAALLPAKGRRRTICSAHYAQMRPAAATRLRCCSSSTDLRMPGE